MPPQCVRTRSICSAGQMVESFALTYEALRRTLGIRLYDQQLQSGMLLCRGMIAEMATGEGKTFCASLPAVFYALRGQSVHVATPNIYLAERDCELLTPVYRLLNCSIGILKENAQKEEKRAIYACDIVYGTGYEFGFDYLREQLAGIADARDPLGRHYRNILRGAARIGFELPCAARRGDHRRNRLGHGRRSLHSADHQRRRRAGRRTTPACTPRPFASPASCAKTPIITIDREAHSVSLTKDRQGALPYGWRPNCRGTNCNDPGRSTSSRRCKRLLLLTKDIDYVTADGKIVLVDGATGRLCPDRNWSEGLHQILEVKENLKHSGELRTAARITRQRYFRMYDMLCGMTGTAMESRWEFWRTFGLHVAKVPLRIPLASAKPCRRDTSSTPPANGGRRSRKSSDMHATGRPVLIGSRTIENSEMLAKHLDEAGIPYQLLNGKQTADEADVVARAGHRGAVTIATNMAGRGTDIKLQPGVAEIGGIHLLAVEPNESLRVDRQLIGRVGRQGDPGSYQFFVSADDALLLRFGRSLSPRMKSMPNLNGELQVDLSRSVRAVQTQIRSRRLQTAKASHRRRSVAHQRSGQFGEVVFVGWVKRSAEPPIVLL